ncbi:MAG TPA: hypothetical protein VJB13_02120 [Candidatus Nanoarchaeia archaeon]|nr:hypothetical protein [Candidatus Nanoarchaeia archaeon]
MQKLLTGGLAALLLNSVCVSQNNQSYTPKKKLEVVQCLSEKATMYGAYWCSACNYQKQEFGPENWNQFKSQYVECSDKGSSLEQDRCDEENITALPTWKFTNGKVVIGYKSLDQLADFAGCK